MDYIIQRDENFAHYSVKGTGWKRAVRLDRLGKEYTLEAIGARLLDRRHIGYVPFRKPKHMPFLTFNKIERRKIRCMDGIQMFFALVIEICRLITGNNTIPETPVTCPPLCGRKL